MALIIKPLAVIFTSFITKEFELFIVIPCFSPNIIVEIFVPSFVPDIVKLSAKIPKFSLTVYISFAFVVVKVLSFEPAIVF